MQGTWITHLKENELFITIISMSNMLLFTILQSLEMLLSPGDYIISEEYIYPGAASIVSKF